MMIVGLAWENAKEMKKEKRKENACCKKKKKGVLRNENARE